MSMFDDHQPDTDQAGSDNPHPPSATEGGEGDFLAKHPRENSVLYGHEQTEHMLWSLARTGRLPHAIMLSGPKGIGKATLGFRLARFVLSGAHDDESGSPAHIKEDNNELHGPGLFGDESLPDESGSDRTDTETAVQEDLYISPESSVFRQVASGGHSDLSVVERAFDETKGRHKGQIDVESIRNLIPFMRMHAVGPAGWKVALVDDADTMNRNAQNAILKILEEPPPKTLIILITHRPGAMLATIRSRSRAVMLSPLERTAQLSLLARGMPELGEGERNLLYDLSSGSPGLALSLYECGAADLYKDIAELMDSIYQMNWPDIHKLADKLASPDKDQELKTFIHIFEWIVRACVRQAACERAAVQEGDNQAAMPDLSHYASLAVWAANLPLKQWLEISDRLMQHFYQWDLANLDRRHCVTGAFAIIEDYNNYGR